MNKHDIDLALKIRKKPVFICGHPKSGTSLLRSLLDNHPQLIVYPEETLFFRKFLTLVVGKSYQGQLKLAEEHLIHIFQWNVTNPPAHQVGYPDRDYQRSISFDQVRAHLRAIADRKFDHCGDILSAAVIAYGKTVDILSDSTKSWVEKTTYNEFFIPQIINWWPEVRFIHLVRDPRDNYATYRRKHPEWNSSFFASNWLRSTKIGLQNQKALGSNRYWILRYEDLTSQPEETIKEICSFLTIDDHPSLRIPSRVGKVWKGNSMFPVRFEKISSGPIGRWKKDLDAQDLYIIQSICKLVMRKFDYKLHEKYSPRITLRTQLEVIKTKLKLLLTGNRIFR